MRQRARTDSNHAAILAALRQTGATTKKVSRSFDHWSDRGFQIHFVPVGGGRVAAQAYCLRENKQTRPLTGKTDGREECLAALARGDTEPLTWLEEA